MGFRQTVTAMLLLVAIPTMSAWAATTPSPPADATPKPPAAGFVRPPVPGPSSEFQPDFVFAGSSIAGLQTLGSGDWRATNGEIVGSAKPGGGWLVLGRSYQDVQFFSHIRCAGPCKAGLMFRMTKTADGYTGVYVSIGDKDYSIYRMTLDGQGRELTRTPVPVAPPFTRVTPPPGTPPRGGFGGRGGRPMELPVPLADLTPPTPGLRASGDWNEIYVAADNDIIRPSMNRGFYEMGAGDMGDAGAGYGPVALRVEEGEVRFKDVGLKDLHLRSWQAEKSSPNYRMQRVDPFDTSWGTDVADINHDGVLDVVAGSWYYLGPDYRSHGEIWYSPTYSPSNQLPGCWYEYAYDFKGDGWPDVLCGKSGAITLYENPRGESRRWKTSTIATTRGEFVGLKDMDKDGKPELIYVNADYTISYAKYDPADPTKPWTEHQVSEKGLGFTHGLGEGDINGDGRLDIIQTAGWWENPGPNATGLWKYHPYAFARWGRYENAGGSEIQVFDINGDGLNDVMTSLHGHGFGLAWFEQKRSASGEIGFVRHMIIDDFTTKNTGDVVTTEMHGSAIADVDGDGVPDFVTGKRFWSHLDSYTDPDPEGAPVLYVYHTVRDQKAPGGARFVPELVSNQSGIGAQFVAKDINGDRAPDIITSGALGTFIFWGNPGAVRAKSH